MTAAPEFRAGDRVVDPVTMAYGTVLDAAPAGYTNQLLKIHLDADPEAEWFAIGDQVAPAPRLAEPGAPRLIFSASRLSPMPPWAASPGRCGAGQSSGGSSPTRPDDGPRPAA